MTTHKARLPQVINNRLFEPDACRLTAPAEGPIGISRTATSVLSELASVPGAPVSIGRLVQSSVQHAATSEESEIEQCIGELNRLLGRLPSGAPAIASSSGAHVLAHEAMLNQPPTTDPRFQPKPFHKRPATWGALIAVALALAAFAVYAPVA